MGNGLYNAIIGLLDDLKSRCRMIDSLMMSAVGGKFGAVEFCQPAAGHRGSHMHFIFRIPLVTIRLRQVLDQISAEVYIQNLVSFADTQNGFPAL